MPCPHSAITQAAANRLRRVANSSAVAAGLLLASTQIAPAQFYLQTNLVSDIPGLGLVTDTNLVGAWGTVHSATSPWWVNTTFSGKSLVINGAGQPLPIVVAVQPTNGASATGIVFNNTDGFQVASNLPARFIFATLNGVISGWNPGQSNPAVAAVLVDNRGAASYAGIALAQNNGQTYLYAANYAKNEIDVFDTNLTLITMPARAFTDQHVPAGLSAFNVQSVGDWLYVTYAPTNALGPGTGAGLGYVSIFDVSGNLRHGHNHLEYGYWMNSPWGITLAPPNFGLVSNRLLVGMFGSGAIASFDPDSGKFRGFMLNTDALPVVIAKGLWGIGFGNGASAGDTNVLYFASDLRFAGQFHGLFGTLSPAPPVPGFPGEGEGGDNGQGDNGNNGGQGNGNNGNQGNGHHGNQGD
jgi:uncharacterized protein (TIGR03118 family)